MDENRKSFVFRKEWYEAIRELDEESRLEMYDAIAERALFGNNVELSKVGRFVMKVISPQIDTDAEKWRNTVVARSEAGKRHKGNQHTRLEQNGTNVPKTEQMFQIWNKTEQNGTKDGIQKPKRNRFVKPTIDEIRAYMTEKGYTFDAEAFYAYYESNGWKVGRNPMKNWRMACTTWSKNRKNNNNYGRETITDKIRRTVEEADRFSQKLGERIGGETDVCDGDNTEVW